MTKLASTIIFALGAVLLLAGCSTKTTMQPAQETSQEANAMEYKNIDGKEMQKLIKEGARLIDVREPSEFQEGHLEGAELIPLGTISETSKSWDKKKPLVMMCRSGNRSGQAASYLKSQGFQEVYNLSGGIMSWKGPILKGNP